MKAVFPEHHSSETKAAATAGLRALRLSFSGLRSDAGSLRVLVFNGPRGFPDEPGQALRTAVLPIRGRRAEVCFHGLPPGRYAVAYFHDANGNGRLDTNLLGQPVEDYGFSGRARGLFGPPRFREAAFRLQESHEHLHFRVGG